MAITSDLPQARHYLRGPEVRYRARKVGFATDRALAAAAGISPEHLSSCLTGRMSAGPKVLAGLVAVLPGVCVDDLAFLARPVTHLEPEPSELEPAQFLKTTGSSRSTASPVSALPSESAAMLHSTGVS